MSDFANPFHEFIEIAIGVGTNIVYVAGVYVVERVLRPLFGTEGVPLFAELVLFLSEFALVLSLASRTWKGMDQLIFQISGHSLSAVSQLGLSKLSVGFLMLLRLYPRRSLGINADPRHVGTPQISTQSNIEEGGDPSTAAGEWRKL